MESAVSIWRLAFAFCSAQETLPADCMTTRSPSLLLEHLEERRLLANDGLRISEFMASNRDTILDADGESSDWVEIHNGSANAVDLKGWSLSDDPLEEDKWIFPGETILEPDARILVWASGKDFVDDNGEYHTNFKLAADGEFIGLFDAQSDEVSSFGDVLSGYPAQQSDVSYGVDASGEVRYFFDPTPRLPNRVTTEGEVADTTFSIDRGFYTESFLLDIQTDTPHATLVVTTDGSVPTPTNGISRTGDAIPPTITLSISDTTVVRAMAYREGWLSTNVDTQTYLFLDQVIEQDGQGLPGGWGHAGADYAMDPEIVNATQYRDLVIPGLQSIPTLSLVTDIDNWFGADVGIYPAGQNSPRPVSAELLRVDDMDGFQIDGSIEIQGGSSTNRWKSDKLSMRLKFKSEFGQGSLEYPLFGDGATDEFDTLIVDAGLNQVWHYGGGYEPLAQRARAQYTRDQFVADLQNQLGGRAPHGQWMHVYLNGIYWGMHNLHERPDEHFAAAYFGGSEDDYDVIKHNSDVVNGTFANYRALINAVNADVSRADRYANVTEILDIDDFINYMLINFYVGNVDWAHHNWYATFNKNSPDGRWRFHSWDAEHVLKELHHDATGRDDELGPTHIHRRLMRNDHYRTRFHDSVQEHLFDGGALTPQPAMAAYQARLDAVHEALVPESARWGDNRRSSPYQRDVEWVAERDRLMQEYFPQRTDVVIEQLRDRGFFHRFDAPQFSQHGGQVQSGFALELLSDGEVYYTVDGSDPMQSPSRQRYAAPLILNQSITLRVRGLHGDDWSALTQATFEVQALLGDVSGDGLLSPHDIDLLFAATTRAEPAARFDLNQDDQVDQADVTYWLEAIVGTRPGDTNLDRKVDFADFVQFSTHFGREEVTWAQGDFNGDGKASFDDFILLSSMFGFANTEEPAG